MTFKNLNFVPHSANPKGSIQASLRLGNGKILSVVAGENLYSTSKDGVRKAVTDPNDVASFEVAVIDESQPDFNVLGWQSREDINQIILDNE